ncbi:hypothetical protein Q3G72_017685 [Acer saccharum]|nr:hypothetical protein Q3G72_017685 [Acer saccharum]
MLEVLSKTKLCQGAKRVLQLMACRRIDRWPEAVSYLMVSYSRAGELRRAMQLLTMMQKAGVKPNFLICNTAIHDLICKAGEGIEVFGRMQLVGITADVKTFNCLIKGYCDLNRIKDAIDLIEKMPCKGCSPDKVSYYTHGHADEAHNFLREAEERGFRVDKIGYSAIVHSFCKEGRMEEVKEIVNQMFQKAKKMLQQMYKHGCKPNTVSYTALLNGLCHNGKSSEARDMINTSEEEWWTPNSITYSVVMHGLPREGKLSEACEL